MEHQHQPEAPAKKATEDHSKMDHDSMKYGDNPNDLAEILFITSYPPRECGIATYSRDLIKALNNKFSNLKYGLKGRKFFQRLACLVPERG